MREVKGDLFEVVKTFGFQAIAITTNGSIRKDGAAVMGRGVAKEAKFRWPGIELVLGKALKKGGNHVHELTGGELFGWQKTLPFRIFSLPVKHIWSEHADIGLIQRSLIELRLKVAENEVLALVRPGCGNGGLRWEDVRPTVERELPGTRYVVVEW